MERNEKATNPRKLRRMSWWRLGLGLLLLLCGLKNLDTHNISADLLPSNPTEWFGFYSITTVFLVGGLVLIVTGVGRIRRRPPQ
jgi:hypothetical protein